MAGRRASRAVQAREKARALTAERRQREQKLEDLATDWFQAEDEIAEIEAAAQRKVDHYIAKVRGEAEREAGQLRDKMTEVVAEMLKHAGVRSVAERLGIPESTARAVKPSATVGTRSAAPTPSLLPTATPVPHPASEPTVTPALEGDPSAVPA